MRALGRTGRGAPAPAQAPAWEQVLGAAPSAARRSPRVVRGPRAGRPAPPRPHLREAGDDVEGGGGYLHARVVVGVRDAADVGRVHGHRAVLRAAPRGHPRAALRARRRHGKRPHLGQVPRRLAVSGVRAIAAARVPAGGLEVVGAHPVLVRHLHLLRPLLPRQLLRCHHPAGALLLRLQVQGQLVGTGRCGHGLGDGGPVRRLRRGQEGEAAGGGSGLHHLVRRRELPGLGRRAQPGQQQHLLRVPRCRALRGPLLLLPRRPPRPAQRHQLPHLRPGRRRLGHPPCALAGAGGRVVADSAAARRTDGPVLRRDGRDRVRRRQGPGHPVGRVGRHEERWGHPGLRHEPDDPRHPGVQCGGGRAEQAARGGAAGEHGPVRVLLQLDRVEHAAGGSQAGGAVRRVSAAAAAGQELRD